MARFEVCQIIGGSGLALRWLICLSKVIVKALGAGFHLVTHRARPLPVGHATVRRCFALIGLPSRDCGPRRRGGSLPRVKHPGHMTYFDQRRAERLTDCDIMHRRKRHVAYECYRALLNQPPKTRSAAIPGPRADDRHPDQRPRCHARLHYWRLRPLELGTRSEPDLE